MSTARYVRWGWRAATPLVVGVILLATLRPSGGVDPVPWAGCLICGSRGVADALVNVLLFAPLGLVLAGTGWRPRAALLCGAALSLAIELVQMYIPGRDPSFGDLLFNTVGTGVGVLAVRLGLPFLRPEASRAARLSLVSGALAMAVVAATGLLLQPSYPSAFFYGQWAADLGHLERYNGRVLSADLGGVAIPGWPIADQHGFFEQLRRRAPLRVQAVAGDPPPALAPLVSVYDHEEREILLVGPDRHDLVFRYRTRALSLRLDQPDVRAVGGLQGLRYGDALSVTVRPDGNGYCLSVNVRKACGLGFTAGMGWSLLYYVEAFPPLLMGLLRAAWVAVLVLPFAYWARRRWESVLGAVLLAAALFVLPGWLGLLPLSHSEAAAAGLGLALGGLFGRHLGRPRPPRLRGARQLAGLGAKDAD